MIKSRRMRWAGHAARMETRNAYRVLVGKPEGKRPLGRPRRRWVDNIVAVEEDHRGGTVSRESDVSGSTALRRKGTVVYR
jgi:hypothetical protein